MYDTILYYCVRMMSLIDYSHKGHLCLTSHIVILYVQRFLIHTFAVSTVTHSGHTIVFLKFTVM